MFEPNQGQTNLDPADPRVRFIAQGSGYSLLLGSQGATLRLYSPVPSVPPRLKSARSTRVDSLQMSLAGGNPHPSITGAELLPGKSNYLLGNDPSKWRTGIPQFARVRYDQVYPGINLVFYGNQGHLEYDFQVAPGADPAQAEVQFDGGKLELQDGALIIRCHNRDQCAGQGSLRLEAPRVYQKIAGRLQPVPARFELRGPNRAGFAIGAYDRSRELVIDPILNFETYFGGSLDELQTSIAVDTSNNVYLAGSTDSPNLPVTAGVLQTTLSTILQPPATNVYIAKITPPLGTTPATLDYVTYLGGTGSDYPVGIEVDAGGDAYLAGTTTSTDFPHSSTAYQSAPENPGKQHVFVTRLNATGASLVYSSYLSGNGIDIASGMTIDSAENIYVTGTTTSLEALLTSPDQFPATQLPNPLPYQSTSKAAPTIPQFFVTVVNTTAFSTGSIAYSTYFGGGSVASGAPSVVTGGGIAVDTNRNVYFTGTTNFLYTGTSPLTDFPILNAYQPCLDQPPATYIPTPQSCTYTTAPGAPDAFAAKINPNVAQGEQLLWSTYLGGTQNDLGTGIAVDVGAANVFVTGTTNSPDFVAATTLATFASFQKCLNNEPVTPPSGIVTCSTTPGTNTDAFVARLSNPTSSSTTLTNVSLTYFSYLGGQDNEEGNAITVDSADGALITGWTQSPSSFTPPTPPSTTYTPNPGTFPIFPYPSPVQGQLNGPAGTQDAFVARLNTAAAVTGQTTAASWATYYGGSIPGNGASVALGQGTGITLDTNDNVYVAGDTNATDLTLNEPLGANANGTSGQYNGGYDAFVAKLSTAAQLAISGVLTLGTNQTYISAGNQATFTYTLTNNGPDLAIGITITDNISSAITGVNLTFVSGTATGGSCSPPSSSSSIVTCNIASLQAGSTAIITIVVAPAASSSGNQAQFNGGAVQASATNSINVATTSVPAQMSDFTVSVSPATVVIPAGQTASYTVQLIPHPVYGNAISLAVSGQPTSGSTATFTTPSVTLQGTSGATTTLNVTTTARPITPPTASLFARRFYAIWLAIPGLAVLGLGGNRRRRRVAGILLLCFVFAILTLQPACSHNNSPPPVSGTPAGTFTMTIAATSGSDTKNVTVSLTVQ